MIPTPAMRAYTDDQLVREIRVKREVVNQDSAWLRRQVEQLDALEAERDRRTRVGFQQQATLRLQRRRHLFIVDSQGIAVFVVRREP